MKKNKFNFPFKIVIGVITICILIFFIGSIRQALKKSDYFTVKDILYKEDKSHLALREPAAVPILKLEASYLKGRNIFSLNLKEESKHITKIYPLYKKIVLVRVLPDRIFLEYKERTPVAYIKLYKYFYIDEELTLFDAAEQFTEADLPIILGLEKKITRPFQGAKYEIKALTAAIGIIKEVKQNKALKDCKIRKIDIINADNLSFLISLPQKSKEGAALRVLEVRLGLHNIKEQVNILSTLFVQIKVDWNNIKYVDLRFKEPVIKLNDAK